MNQIINMFVRIVMRRVINSGINAGIGAATNRSRRRKPDGTGAEPQQKAVPGAGDQAKQAKRMLKMTRRFTRF